MNVTKFWHKRICEASLVIAGFVLVLYFVGLFEPAGSANILVSDPAAALIAITTMVSALLYLWIPQQSVTRSTALVFGLLALSVFVLVATSGGFASPFVALVMFVGILAGVFGVIGIIATAAILNIFLLYTAISGSINFSEQIITIILCELSLLLGYLVWVKKPKLSLATIAALPTPTLPKKSKRPVPRATPPPEEPEESIPPATITPPETTAPPVAEPTRTLSTATDHLEALLDIPSLDTAVKEHAARALQLLRAAPESQENKQEENDDPSEHMTIDKVEIAPSHTQTVIAALKKAASAKERRAKDAAHPKTTTPPETDPIETIPPETSTPAPQLTRPPKPIVPDDDPAPSPFIMRSQSLPKRPLSHSTPAPHPSSSAVRLPRPGEGRTAPRERRASQ